MLIYCIGRRIVYVAEKWSDYEIICDLRVLRSKNDGFNIYMAEISQQLSNFSQEPLIEIPSPSHMEKEEKTSTDVNEPLVQVSWHQKQPFNWYCSSP